MQSFDRIKGPNGAMIVFYRSADWCPFCQSQLVELQESRETLRKAGLGLAAISYDSVAVLENFSKRKGIEFPLLSDPDSKIIREFGILNESVPKDNPFYGIPHPVTYIVDSKGIVISRKFDEDYRQRYTVGNILTEKLDIRTGAAQSQVETRHLKVTASATNSKVRPGERIRLLLDIDLKPAMHVYAPGVEGYLPIEWKMMDSPTVQVMPTINPASKKLRLEAIQETVDVYQGTVTLQREVVVGTQTKGKPVVNEAGQILIEGTLRYQACDDRLCYLPQTVPLKWTLQYEPHDSQRVPEELQLKVH
jgi:peroxiredoxin